MDHGWIIYHTGVYSNRRYRFTNGNDCSIASYSTKELEAMLLE